MVRLSGEKRKPRIFAKQSPWASEGEARSAEPERARGGCVALCLREENSDSIHPGLFGFTGAAHGLIDPTILPMLK